MFWIGVTQAGLSWEVGIFLCVCVCVEGIFYSVALHLVFWGKIPHKSLTNQLYWVVSKPLVSSCLLLPWARITGSHCHARLVMCWGSELRSSCLPQQVFYPLSHVSWLRVLSVCNGFVGIQPHHPPGSIYNTIQCASGYKIMGVSQTWWLHLVIPVLCRLVLSSRPAWDP